MAAKKRAVEKANARISGAVYVTAKLDLKEPKRCLDDSSWDGGHVTSIQVEIDEKEDVLAACGSCGQTAYICEIAEIPELIKFLQGIVLAGS